MEYIPQIEDNSFKEDIKASQDFRESKWKWILVIFCAFVGMGNYYCYDIPSALMTQIKENYELDDTQFNTLYSVYSIPNIFLAILGGILIDKVLGIKLSMVIFAGFEVLGQCLFAYSASIASFPVAIVGRLLFGIGGETLVVSISYMLSKWFKNQYLSFVLNLGYMLPRIGSATNDFIGPILCSYQNLAFALWIGGVITILGFLCAFSSSLLDRYADKINQRRPLFHELEDQNDQEFSFRDIKDFGIVYWLLLSTGILIEQPFYLFINIGTGFMESVYHFGEDASSRLIAVPYITVALISLFLGYLIDKIGKRSIFFIITALLFLCAHVFFGLILNCEDECYEVLIGLILIGLGFSFYSALLWPSIPFVIKQKAWGTGLGFLSSLSNLCGAIFPIIAGKIMDSTVKIRGGYFYSEVFLMCLSFTSLVMAILLRAFNLRKGGILDSKTKAEEKKREDSAPSSSPPPLSSAVL